ncbi:hypothetical protein [Kosakonia sacchari]|uniref:DUF1496 domain-containing protein n=1 Tax=Kosakonia sacchari TaxID=1158459 RepID=A0ABZ0MVH5_9ENTR|nr:hypothetical protein [Kosakonia sacchari]WOZ79489.1 hypothetical protein Q8Y70_10735 [Kosakonia sacchari]
MPVLLFISSMAYAGDITMVDPQQEETANGKTICTYENNTYTFTYITKGKCPYTKTFDTKESK